MSGAPTVRARRVRDVGCPGIHRASRAARVLASVLGALLIGMWATACGRGERRPSEVVPGHSWRIVSGRGGPTYTFRAGQQVEMAGVGGMLMGTYQFPTDSTLALDVTGRIPGAGLGLIHLTPRFDIRVLPAGPDGRERVEFRAGTNADTLARAD